MIKSYLKKQLGKFLDRKLHRLAKGTTGWKIFFSKKLKLTFLLNVDNFIDFIIYKHGVFEQDVLVAIYRYINSSDKVLFVDIGAHIGQMSLCVAKNFPNATVVAFEPEPNTYIQHRAQQVINNLDYHLYNYGVGESHSERVLYLPETSPTEDYGKYNNGMATLLPNKLPFIASSVLVKSVPLGEFLIKQVDVFTFDKIVLKIDVEGAELDVIKGALPLLRSDVNICMVIEMLVVENKAECKKVYDMLESIGFNAYTLNYELISWEVIKVSPSSNYLFTNNLKIANSANTSLN